SDPSLRPTLSVAVAPAPTVTELLSGFLPIAEVNTLYVPAGTSRSVKAPWASEMATRSGFKIETRAPMIGVRVSALVTVPRTVPDARCADALVALASATNDASRLAPAALANRRMSRAVCMSLAVEGKGSRPILLDAVHHRSLARRS